MSDSDSDSSVATGATTPTRDGTPATTITEGTQDDLSNPGTPSTNSGADSDDEMSIEDGLTHSPTPTPSVEDNQSPYPSPEPDEILAPANAQDSAPVHTQAAAAPVVAPVVYGPPLPPGFVRQPPDPRWAFPPTGSGNAGPSIPTPDNPGGFTTTDEEARRRFPMSADLEARLAELLSPTGPFAEQLKILEDG
jgi:hypothetical protein